MYLYHTTIYKETSSIHGLNVSQNNADKADFEDNHKASAIVVDSVDIAETTFTIQDDYTTFSGRITTPIVWSDVKYIEEQGRYVLYLESTTAL